MFIQVWNTPDGCTAPAPRVRGVDEQGADEGEAERDPPVSPWKSGGTVEESGPVDVTGTEIEPNLEGRDVEDQGGQNSRQGYEPSSMRVRSVQPSIQDPSERDTRSRGIAVECGRHDHVREGGRSGHGGRKQGDFSHPVLSGHHVTNVERLVGGTRQQTKVYKLLKPAVSSRGFGNNGINGINTTILPADSKPNNPSPPSLVLRIGAETR
ncbi:hypothetical protein B0H17DRAFT_1186791 [Mycena rosella]|uniref:Uncharacterized protein n=1 Tax=Mycena rosella TaxID=1033263 RepID=A0AAD7G0V2_MYCRO|nr:hypothetical protein B0H17DRAFT_1186791 [Mycena rosella]